MVCTVVVVIYTYIGGMWAVSVTDFIQTIMIVVIILLIAWQVGSAAGGVSKVLESTPPGFQFSAEAFREHHPLYCRLDHYWAGQYSGQDVFQRHVCPQRQNAAVRASYLSGFMYLTIGAILYLLGFAYYILYPDDVHGGDTQMVIPFMVLEHSNLCRSCFRGAAVRHTQHHFGAVLAPPR